MNCGRFEKLIDSYLDSRLAGTLLAEFHAHRLNCRRCSRVVSMLQAAGDVIAQDHCEPKISVDFADRVLAAMPVAQKVNRSVWIVRLGAGAAGLAAAAAIIFAAMLGGQAPSQQHGVVAGGVAINKDSGITIPKDTEVTHHSTLLNGGLVRDAMDQVDQVFRWDEVQRKGE